MGSLAGLADLQKRAAADSPGEEPIVFPFTDSVRAFTAHLVAQMSETRGTEKHIRRGSVIAGSLFAGPEESANCIRAVACHN
jgi:hypothetical protein